MTKQDLAHLIIETDVLVIGGGPGGCFAAFAANDLGADVTILEKAAIRRSGNLATGVDDARFANPEITISAEEFARSVVEPMEGMVDPNLAYVLGCECYDRVLDLERIGVKMREDDGTFKRFPKRHPSAFWFRGADLKLRMTDELQRRKIRVIERSMATRLLTEGREVVGATALNGRDGKFIVCKAKSVILTTGAAVRLYSIRGTPFLTHYCPACSGDGIAMAYHAGAELAGMEFKSVATRPSNPRIIPAMGAVNDAEVPVVNARGESVVSGAKTPDKLSELVLQHRKGGGGLLFWDFPALTENAHIQFERAAMNERPICLKNLREDGLDLRKDRIEISHLDQEGIEPHMGGILIDEECRASAEGLYGAGDTLAILGLRGNSALSAMTLGHRSGRFAAKRAKEVGHGGIDAEKVEAEKKRVFAPVERRDGFEPLHLEEKVYDIMTTYCGIEKSGERMERGLELLLKAKLKHLDKVMARNPHHLMRFLELCNVFDVAEMHLRASIMRKESRLGLGHRRIDYPKKDDQNWRKLIVIHKLDGDMKLETRDVPRKKGQW